MLARSRGEEHSPAAATAPPEEQSSTTGSSASGLPLLFPLGHFYSPVCDPEEIRARHGTLWPAAPRPTLDLDWRESEQLRLNELFAAQIPLGLRQDEPEDPSEYWCGNDQYPPMDALVLAAMLRHLRPQRVIEIGSGFSSLVTARINREEMGGQMRFTCIEPYPREYLRAGVDGITELRIQKIQDAPLELFEKLEAGDVLFIDTSHTVKTGNDVTWIFHEIVPRLAVGVAVHVHDIFLPEEYPESWVLEGRGWNEHYLVRSFLAYNASFHILWATRHMLAYHVDDVARAFPIAGDGYCPAGALWFRRVA